MESQNANRESSQVFEANITKWLVVLAGASN